MRACLGAAIGAKRRCEREEQIQALKGGWMLPATRGLVLDEERKAAMVSSLLVLLCGEREAQPVINTGALQA
ncbi:MAG: hypothetical protein PHO07_15890 [Pirellulales bacterium]|jgi:hypothetical protein|nr:hypothetical protein [Thermoguttaceae bacterium]MDD4788656.1 hypothetical protein [Pirellulales bacterium]